MMMDMEKRLLWSVLAVAAWLLPVPPAAAQPFDDAYYRRMGREPVAVETADRDSLGIDTLRRIDTVDGAQVRLRDGGEGRMLLEVGGFGLTLGRSYESKAWDDMKRKKVWMTLLRNFEFGFNYLSGVDYAGYEPGQRGFLDQRLGPSFHFSFHIVGLGGTFNRSRSLTYDVGLQYTVDNIRLADNSLTVRSVQGRIVPVALDEPADKSKIVCSYLGIPLRFNYRPAKRVELSAVLYNDFLLGADAIRKHPKKKHGVSGFRGYRFGVGLSGSYRGFGLFARYAPTPLFRSGAGPECRTVSFGVSYSLHL